MCCATPRYVPYFDDITCPHNITCAHLDDDRVRAKQLRISRAPRVPVDVDDGDIFHEIVQRDVLPERRAIPQFLRVLLPSHDEGRVSHVEQLRVPLFPSFTNIERGEVVEGRVQEPGRGSPPHGLICLLSPRVRPTVTHEPAIPRIPSGDPQIAHHPPRPRSPACPRRDTIRCRACGRACATRGGGIARGPRGRSRGTVRVWSRRARESIGASSSRLMTGIRPVIRHSGSAGGLPGLTSSVSVVNRRHCFFARWGGGPEAHRKKGSERQKTL